MNKFRYPPTVKSTVTVKNAVTVKNTVLRLAVHIGAWIPLCWLVIRYITDNLTVNPIQAATQFAGKTALVLLVLSLACTPANSLFGFHAALKLRRPLGLYAFMYAAIHLAIFIGLDYRFDWSLLLPDIANKRYIFVGLAALLILLALAVTSFKWWMRKLGKNWKRLHRLVYLAGPLVILHYAWASKGSALRLQGEIWQPLAFGMLVALLLALRLPQVRRWITRLRSGIRQRVGSPTSRPSTIQNIDQSKSDSNSGNISKITTPQTLFQAAPENSQPPG